MEKRISTEKDKEAIKELWEHSLHYTKGFSDWYFNRVFVPENTLITREGQDLMSSLSVIPQKIRVSGIDIDAAYISGLAVLPEYRTEENMKQQLMDAVAAVSQRGYLLSILVPPNYRFYEKYGWRTAYSYKQYDIKLSDLPAYQIKGTFERAKINDVTIQALSEIYHAFTSDKNAYTLRDKEAWNLILEDLFYNFGGNCAILRDQEKNPVGYMLNIVRDKKMGVYEFAYKNRTAYEGLIGFIHAHELSIDSAAIKAAADDLSYLDFCDNREAVRFCPFAVARISNACEALKIAAAGLGRDFKIQIIDRLIEANNKTFQLSDNAANEVDDIPDVITDIGTLTQLFLGYISVEEACKMNLISGEQEYLLQIFEKKNNYINMLLI